MALSLTDLIFRYTTTLFTGKDGAGKLTSAEGDSNTYALGKAIIDLQDAGVGVGIASIDAYGVDQIMITLTDETTQGPFDLPFIAPNPRGAWATGINYVKYDIVAGDGDAYMCLWPHLSSGTTFDPNANDGQGHDYWGLYLQTPDDLLAVELTTPVDGDLITYDSSSGKWINEAGVFPEALRDLEDVVVETSIPDGDILAFDSTAGKWINQSPFEVVKITSKSEATTTHTIGTSDPWSLWNCTNSSGCVVTVPDDDDYDAPVDTEVSFRQGADVEVTFDHPTTVTVDFGVMNSWTSHKGGVVTLKKIAANYWIGFGALAQGTS